MGNNKHTYTFSHGRRKRYIKQSLQVPNTTGPTSEVELCTDVICAIVDTKEARPDDLRLNDSVGQASEGVNFSKCNSVAINSKCKFR